MDYGNPAKSARLYAKKIIFFSIFSKALYELRVSVGIEPKTPVPNADDKFPDFIVYDNIISILEHKTTLPNNEEYFLSIVKETYEKYCKIEHNGSECPAEVILLVPKTCTEIFEKCESMIKEPIVVWVFDLDMEEQKLQLAEVFGKTENKALKGFLKETPSIEFKLSDYSRYKFLREPVHPVYTALLLWQTIFRINIDPLISSKESYIIDYDSIKEECKSFYPKWIGTERDQITARRLNKALTFLRKIGFIKISDDHKTIEVFHRKGTNAYDLLEYFSEKYIKKDIKTDEESQEQSSLKTWIADL